MFNLIEAAEITNGLFLIKFIYLYIYFGSVVAVLCVGLVLFCLIYLILK